MRWSGSSTGCPASEHDPRFVLEGALLFALWMGEPHRPTRDLDLLGFSESSAEGLAKAFRSVCAPESTDDGLVFTADSVAVEAIREDQEYGGQRVKLEARLAGARLDLQVDVGYGDVITPGPEVVEYPTLLGMEPLRLRAYPHETVVAAINAVALSFPSLGSCSLAKMGRWPVWDERGSPDIR